MLNNNTTKPSPSKAVAYLRVSGLGQEDGDGFDRQRDAINRYAAANSITVTQWFQDTQTGKDEWQNRPGWVAMLTELSKGEVEGCTGCAAGVILVEKLDRVARRVFVQEMIVEDLKKRGVCLITSGGDNSGDEDPERVMFRQMLAVFAQYERAVIVAKMGAARAKIRAKGLRCEGVKPYGTKSGEADVLEVMRIMRKRGDSHEAIAAGLNQARAEAGGVGYMTRRGGKWLGPSVCKILRREGL